MPRGRYVRDALSKSAATAHNVKDLRLVTVDLDCTRSHEICCGVQIHKLRIHPVFSFSAGLIPPAFRYPVALPCPGLFKLFPTLG
jgi:hypothetical protein